MGDDRLVPQPVAVRPAGIPPTDSETDMKAAPLTTAAAVRAALADLADDGRARQAARYMRAVPGGYGEGDRFIRVTMPLIRGVVKRTVLDDAELELLVDSAWHEERMAALLVAVARVGPINRLLPPGMRLQPSAAEEVVEAFAGRERLGRRYLDWTSRGLVNNWDLVDASAEHLVGPWLFFPLVRPEPAADDALESSTPLPHEIE